MAWQAIDQLEVATDATKRLLFPFSLKNWVILAIIVFFVGGTGSANINFGNVPGTVSAPPGVGTGIVPPIGIDYVTGVLVVLVVGGILLLLGLIALLIRAIMEFVFVEVARTGVIKIRGYFGKSSSKGLSLFALWFTFGLIVVATAIMILVFTVFTFGIFLLILLILSPFFIVLGLAVWAFFRFTVDFVVPIMITDDVGIIAGWQTFWEIMVAQWQEYGVYAGIRLVIGFIAGIVSGIGLFAVAIVLAIPFGIIGFGGLYILSVALAMPNIASAYGITVLILFILATIIVSTIVVQVPIQTYLRYYALLVLGGINPQYDLLEDFMTGQPSPEPTPDAENVDRPD